MRVLPAENVGVKVGPVCPLPALFLHPEMYLEEIDEVSKKEATVDVCLNVIWQFGHESHVNLRLDGIILIVRPIVLEVSLEPLGHLLGQWAAPVEVSEETQPLGEVLTVLIIRRHVLQVHEDVNELAHDVGEASDTD